MGFASNLAIDKLSERHGRRRPSAPSRPSSSAAGRRSCAPRDRLRAEHPGRAPAELARLAIARTGKHVAGTGAVSALPATIPGRGDRRRRSARRWATRRSSPSPRPSSCCSLAHLYGRPVTDVEARRLDVLMAMGVEAGVVDLRRNGVVRVMGTIHRDGELSGAAGVAGSPGRISRRLAAQVAGKLARRRAYVHPRPGGAGRRHRARRRLQHVVDAQARQSRARATSTTSRARERRSAACYPRRGRSANVWARWRSRWSTRPPFGSPESETFPSTVW